MHRPDYLALDEQGLEYRRKAMVIGELPVGARASALIEATAAIATKTGLIPVKQIPFGSRVFTAFDGLNRPTATHHAESKLLLTRGDDVPLDYCPCYN